MKYLFVSIDDVNKIVRDYCKIIKEEYPKTEDIILAGVTNGGFEIASKIHEIIPNTTLIAYEPDEETPIAAEDTEKIKGKNIIVCEDSTISGNTLNRAIYVISNYGALDCRALSIVYRRGSKIIPNLYAMECDNGDIVIFPWKNLPIRKYLHKNIKTLRLIEGDGFVYKHETEKLLLLREGKVDNYSKKTIVVDKEEGTAIGFVQFWESDEDLVIDKAQGFTSDERELETILKELYHLILNYTHFHCKDSFSFLIPLGGKKKWTDEGYTSIRDLDFDGENYCEMRLTGTRPIQ